MDASIIKQEAQDENSGIEQRPSQEGSCMYSAALSGAILNKLNHPSIAYIVTQAGVTLEDCIAEAHGMTIDSYLRLLKPLQVRCTTPLCLFRFVTAVLMRNLFQLPWS